MVSQREVEARANRIRGLTAEAIRMMKEGKSEDEIRAALEEMALYNWGLSPGALYNYIKTALIKAKSQYHPSE